MVDGKGSKRANVTSVASRVPNNQQMERSNVRQRFDPLWLVFGLVRDPLSPIGERHPWPPAWPMGRQVNTMAIENKNFSKY